ncbi:response regulator transcription factor [Rhodoferax sp. AJA081-3]|uniref:response regulator transcription factor n=1 Tax=Rhodoferax sp. AJA081-3 TaxID=2752316 RepID=UPI001AE08599|nr:response regulator transcription factor [Rhodoferax sp. AJA081-3]QTN27240.1 response regulator transcription factor [Rhodoferax sp. AJA081-3]
MKILIAEDDQHIGDGLCAVVEAEGYTPVLARDGEQALQLFHAHAPQLILLDIMMPKRDGYAVCREIRRVDTQVPVIFISAKSEEIDRVVGLELGADDYIVKPFGVREVIARIRAVTRRTLAQRPAQELSPESLRLGDLEVFPTQLRARRGEQQMDLSLRDVKILQCLFEQRGQVVDRDTLFNTCWGREYFPNSRTLDQHISKLRKLVERDAKHPEIICTVHGVGYRFD